MRETNDLEFKQDISASFLKTVSAFANYNGGSILFGVDDNGKAVGVNDPVQTCISIENKINDTVSPRPDYSLEVRKADSVVELKVKPGHSKPYLYRSKAYKRSDSSTVEVDRIELNRLVLEGSNSTFEEQPASDQNLTFKILGDALTKHLGLEVFNKDTLRTLNLLSNDNGYNNAAAILADENSFPGVDIVRFGESTNTIERRVTSESVSALLQLESALQVYEDLYCYEKIDGFKREEIELIPREAFREAVANAIVHRTWDVSAHIQIAMFNDRIEVSSPGGLPTGISEEEYLSDMISVRRNPILANVFFRLGIIEAFGTGVLRIKNSYVSSIVKPQFSVGTNRILVTLPVLRLETGLTDDQQFVYELLSPVRAISAGDLETKVSFSRSKLNSILKKLVSLGLATTTGSGRGVKYQRV